MKDASIVTIYDLENGGKPLECHRIDANEFLRFPRWSLTPGKQGTATDPFDMTIAQIKERLAFRDIDIPDGVTKKADLQALLDGAK